MRTPRLRSLVALVLLAAPAAFGQGDEDDEDIEQADGEDGATDTDAFDDDSESDDADGYAEDDEIETELQRAERDLDAAKAELERAASAVAAAAAEAGVELDPEPEPQTGDDEAEVEDDELDDSDSDDDDEGWEDFLFGTLTGPIDRLGVPGIAYVPRVDAWMLMYRFGFSSMDNAISGVGTSGFAGGVGADDVLDRNDLAPVQHTEFAHRLSLRHAPVTYLSFAAEASFYQRATSYLREVDDDAPLVQESAGIGDVQLHGTLRVFSLLRHQLFLSLGGSLPTGTVDARGRWPGDDDAPVETRLPYALQIGSGSFGIVPALTFYGFISDRVSWGAQLRGSYWLTLNRHNYQAPHRTRVSAFVSAGPWEWATVYGRIDGDVATGIAGSDEELDEKRSFDADPDGTARGALWVAMGGSLNGPSRSFLDGASLGGEVLVPMVQYVAAGPQLAHSWGAGLFVRYVFDLPE